MGHATFIYKFSCTPLHISVYSERVFFYKLFSARLRPIAIFDLDIFTPENVGAAFVVETCSPLLVSFAEMDSRSEKLRIIVTIRNSF